MSDSNDNRHIVMGTILLFLCDMLLWLLYILSITLSQLPITIWHGIHYYSIVIAISSLLSTMPRLSLSLPINQNFLRGMHLKMIVFM